MNQKRSSLHLAVLAITAALAIAAASPTMTAFAQVVMDRTGTVGIQNDTERQLFWGLLCTCGCPRETLGTCTCGFAHQRRAELREELRKGKSIEQIKADYTARFGTVALAVPPNEGAQRAVWLVPLLALVAGAGIVGFVLRRFVRGAKEEAKAPAPAGKPLTKAEDEKYDDKLDEELKALDKE